MKAKSTLNQIDGWSNLHFFGCAMLAIWIANFCLWRDFEPIAMYLYSFVIAFVLGVIWEWLGDKYKHIRPSLTPERQKFWDTIFDPRGFSWLDCVFDGGGALLGSGIVYLITLIGT
ncbi:MAG: hypothetical protein H8D42_04715 [Candidatus Marinimicrobia bacterium]|nr:hypothetical protein [Candidatus Neomarinimicrobiota bacterium]